MDRINWINQTAERIHIVLGEPLNHAIMLATSYHDNQKAYHDAINSVVSEGVPDPVQLKSDGYVDVPYINRLGETLLHTVFPINGEGEEEGYNVTTAVHTESHHHQVDSDSSSSSSSEEEDTG